jgi:WD40 repeat protein
MAGGSDGFVYRLDGETGALIGQLQVGGWITSVGLSPDGRMAGIASYGAQLWDVNTGNVLGPDMKMDNNATFVRLIRGGRALLAGDIDGNARLWKTDPMVPSGSMVRVGPGDSVIAIAPDGRSLVTQGKDRMVRLWSIETGARISQAIAAGDEPIDSYFARSRIDLAFGPEGPIVSASPSKGTVRVWNLRTGQQIGKPIDHGTDLLISSALSPDGQFLATAGRQRTARVWDLRTGASVGSPFVHGAAIYALAFNRESTMLATWGEDGIVRRWDIKNHALSSQTKPIQSQGQGSVAFSPDLGLIITFSLFGDVVRLWDGITGSAVGEAVKCRPGIGRVSFRDDGRSILVNTHNWVHLFRLGDTGMVHEASRLSRGMYFFPIRNPFLETTGDRVRLASEMTADLIALDTYRFDDSDGTPLEGDPDALFADWQRKLWLRIDQDGNIRTYRP